MLHQINPFVLQLLFLRVDLLLGSKGFQELLVIKVNTRNTIDEVVSGSRFFEFAEGSDWEQLSKLNLPDQSFIDVHAASF